MKRQLQRGFTLIELMIVVAIIGILAAIAIPQYQDYTIRARVSEGVNLASSAKTAVSEYYNTNKVWPTNAASAGFTSAASAWVGNVDINTGIILVTLSNTASLGGASQGQFNLSPVADANNTSVSWICRAGGGTGTAVPAKYLPANCR